MSKEEAWLQNASFNPNLLAQTQPADYRESSGYFTSKHLQCHARFMCLMHTTQASLGMLKSH